MSRKPHNFLIYATLLDTYEGYINSSRVWQQYYGYSEEPAKSEEEFEQEQKQALLDRINRVPFDSEAADKGTAFNEVLDCLIMGRKSSKCTLRSDKEAGTITAEYNGRTFVYPLQQCVQLAKDLEFATPQVYCEGTLPTKHGDVLLYGYIDELMPFSIVDIKTTSKYEAFKYRHNWQHIVYPYCLWQTDPTLTDIKEFEYLIAVMPNSNEVKSFNIRKELYCYDPNKDIPRLREHCEGLIDFIEANKSKITDLKIFNKH